MTPIARLDNGLVDPSSALAESVTEALSEIQKLPERQQIGAIAELLLISIEVDWWELFTALAHPSWVLAPPADFHRHMWAWGCAIDDTKPPPFIACWPRGAAKSSNAQMLVVYLACKQARPYAIYVGATQKAAEAKIGDIASLLMSPALRVAFPGVGDIFQDNIGRRRDWTKNRIRNEHGFTLDALGMDVALRGIKVDADRPGLIVLDDLETKLDSPHITRKKLDVLTHDIIPAGSDNAATLFVQNVIHPNSIMATLTDNRAEILNGRQTSGPIPQIQGLRYKRTTRTINGEPTPWYQITAGTPTWPQALNLDTSEKQLNEMGPTAFEGEKQHRAGSEKTLWNIQDIEDMSRPDNWPTKQAGGLARIVVSVDPSVGDGSGDDCGIVVCGLAQDNRVYVLDDMTVSGLPSKWAKQVGLAYVRWNADSVVAEDNQGGALVVETLSRYSANLPIERATSKAGKRLRAEPVQLLSQQGRVRFAGSMPDLAHQMVSWEPPRVGEESRSPSPDRLDAFVLGVLYLLPVDTGAGDLIRVRRPVRR